MCSLFFFFSLANWNNSIDNLLHIEKINISRFVCYFTANRYCFAVAICMWQLQHMQQPITNNRYEFCFFFFFVLFFINCDHHCKQCMQEIATGTKTNEYSSSWNSLWLRPLNLPTGFFFSMFVLRRKTLWKYFARKQFLLIVAAIHVVYNTFNEECRMSIKYIRGWCQNQFQ